MVKKSPRKSSKSTKARSPRFHKKDGFRSGVEVKADEYLDTNNVTYEYETYSFPYVVKKKYIPDFVILDPSLDLFNNCYIEVKGRFSSSDRQKMATIKQTYPNLDFRLVFQKDNLLYKGSKSRYSDWAKKNGFEYHVLDNPNVFELPRKWLKEFKNKQSLKRVINETKKGICSFVPTE